MSANRFLPHVLVLPEDDANRQLANGFQKRVTSIRQMVVLRVAGGWKEVLNRFQADHVRGMELYDNRYMVLLLDFDGDVTRLETAREAVPPELRDRVFILGALTNPEELKRAQGMTLEAIGSELADGCRENNNRTWGHDLLRHNEAELTRLRTRLGPIISIGP